MTPTADGSSVTLLLLTLLISVALYAWTAIALAAMFRKMGEQPWKGWVPVFNIATLLRWAGFNPWLVLLVLVPFAGVMIVFVLVVVSAHRIDPGFGYGGGMTVVAALLFPVWASILGFGPARWLGARPATALPETTKPIMPAVPGPPPARPASLPGPVAPALRGRPRTSGRPRVADLSSPPPPVAQPTGAQPVGASAVGVPSVGGADLTSPAIRDGAPMPPLPPYPAAAPVPPAPAGAPVPPAPAAVPVPPPPVGVPVPSALGGAPVPPAPAAAPVAPVPAGAPVPPVSMAPPTSASFPAFAPPPEPARLPEPSQPGPPTLPLNAVTSAEVWQSDPARVPAPSPFSPGPSVDSAGDRPVAPPPHLDGVISSVPVAGAPATTATGDAAWAHDHEPPDLTADDAFPEMSGEISAVVGSPAAGSPLPARGSVSAQHREREQSSADEDDIDLTILARRKRPRWRLILPDGRSVELTGTSAVVGRQPASSSAFPGAQLIPVEDPSRTVSKTHALLELRGDQWHIIDLHSTNGVLLAGDGDVEVEPGAAAPAGERFLLGDAAFQLSRNED